MTQTAVNELSNTLSDPEEPFTPELEEAAVGVTTCLQNVLRSSSDTSHAVGNAARDSSSSKVNSCIQIIVVKGKDYNRCTVFKLPGSLVTDEGAQILAPIPSHFISTNADILLITFIWFRGQGEHWPEGGL